MKRKPLPLLQVVAIVTGLAIAFVAAVAVTAKITDASFESALNAIARFEATTKWGPVAVVDAVLVLAVLVAVLATNALQELARLAVDFAVWLLRTLGYTVQDPPAIPGTTLVRAIAVPFVLWLLSIIVVAVAP